MRSLSIMLGCCITMLSLKQASAQSLRIQINYEKQGKYLEQAVETIEAINAVNIGATVDYQAGKSVLLLPGFVAKNGSTFTAEIKPVDSKSEFSLQLNAYPNPFEQATIINFTLPEAGTVSLLVINEQGQVVERLLEDSLQTAGRHQFEWKPNAIRSGIYMPVLKTERQTISSRIVKK